MKRKGLIKTCLVMMIVGIVSFSDWGFAAEDSSELAQIFGEMLYLIISILSWIWVFFAKGAGEFLTNKWVYGEAIGLDVVLWQYRNVMKNFANFGLGFYFLYVVFKGLIDQKDVVQNLKKVILWLLVAGIGIQASWFFTAAVIDASTVTLAAAGSFPSLVASESYEVNTGLNLTLNNYFNEGKGIINKFEFGQRISLFSPDSNAAPKVSVTKEIPLNTGLTLTGLFDQVMPNAENVSGPLYYLGLSILKTTSTIVSPNATDKIGWYKTIFNLLLQGGTTIVYSIEMLVLLVVAVMRMVYMRIFIVLSPIAILLWCIGQCADKGGKGGGLLEKAMDGFKKQINFSSFFWNAFKPSLIVLGFSVVMIFVTLMNSVIISEGTKSYDVGGMTIYQHEINSQGSNEGDKEYVTSLEGDSAGLVLRSAGKTLFGLLLAILTVFLVYVVLKKVMEMGGSDFVSDKTKKLQNFVEDGIGMLPLMPVAGYDKNGKPTKRYLSAGKVFGFGEGNESLISSGIRNYQGNVNNKIAEQNSIITSWIGDKTEYLSSEEIRDIRNAGSGSTSGSDKLTAMKNAIVKIKSENGKGMTLSRETAKNDGFWLNQFGQRLDSMKNQSVTGTKYNQVWNKMIEAWNSSKITDIEKKLEEIFKDNTRVRAYADFFGLNLSSDDWEHLKNADISKK